MQLGQVSGGTTESSNSSAAADSSTSAPAPEASGGGEKEDYNAAVALAMKSKSKAQIDEAIGALQSFIKSYPKSSYQSNANYWLGNLTIIKVAKMMRHSTLQLLWKNILNPKKQWGPV